MLTSNRVDLKNNFHTLTQDILLILTKEPNVKNGEIKYSAYEGSYTYWHTYKELFQDYISNSKFNLLYVSSIDLNILNSKLSSIKAKLIEAYEKLNFGDETHDYLESVRKEINDLNIINKIKYEYIADESYTKEDAIELLNNLESILHFQRIDELRNYIFESSEIDFISILKYLIPLKNSDNIELSKIKAINYFDNLLNEKINFESKKNEINKIKEIYNEAEKTLKESVALLEKTQKSTNEAKNQYVKVREVTNQEQNKQLLDMFYREYKDLENPIKKLNFFIVVIFSIIIGFYFLLFLLNIYPTETKQYLLYVSSLIFSSGLLGYLIKERNRLIKFHDYSKKMFLETNAIAGYVASLETKEANKLRIDLAQNYFTGYKQDNNITPNPDIPKVLESLDGIKKLITQK